MSFFAHIAQQEEHVIGNDEVTGSNPVVGLRFCLVESCCFSSEFQFRVNALVSFPGQYRFFSNHY